MHKLPFRPPQSGSQAFSCPHCAAYAKQEWYRATGTSVANGLGVQFYGTFFTLCSYCGKSAVWIGETLVHPPKRTAPRPNDDLLPDIKADYDEAASIEKVSPRGAAALLRLCVQKICKQIGEKGENINNDIEKLIAKGLPVEVKEALDVVRVTGNNAVHPGEMNLNESRDAVATLFILVNMIADRMITQPKKVKEMFSMLPKPTQEAIAKRDAKALPKSS